MIDPQSITTLIFDFDGTIADSLELHRQIYNQLAARYHRDHIAQSHIQNLRDLEMKDFLKKMKIPLLQLPSLIQEAQKIANDRPVSQPILGITSVIKTLSERFTLGIVTSNTQDYCETFLKQHRLETYFSFVQAERDLFGKDHKLKKLLRDKKLSRQETVYIGDEVRDIEAARKIPLQNIGVAWGFNSTEALKNAQADMIFADPQELLSFFTSRQ
jgi:phosphoglycolate phosphatase-like HAD superfamily hydrolase